MPVHFHHLRPGARGADRLGRELRGLAAAASAAATLPPDASAGRDPGQQRPERARDRALPTETGPGKKPGTCGRIPAAPLAAAGRTAH